MKNIGTLQSKPVADLQRRAFAIAARRGTVTKASLAKARRELGG